MEANNIFQDVEKWKKLLESDDLYIGGTCALLYALDFEDYLKGQEIGDYVSLLFIVNSSGRDKKELVAFGKEKLENVGSLPLKYYHCSEPKVTIPAIATYLSKWNQTLKTAGRNVKLIINFPHKSIQQFTFSNIELLDATNTDYIFKSMNNIVKCFKFHYRKLQILKYIVREQNSKNMVFLDYINMISAAWHNVSSTYVYSNFNESADHYIDVNEKALSLTDWCGSYNVPLNCWSSSTKPLDDFVYYDNQLSSIKFEEEQETQLDKETAFSVVTLNSEIEAFQAMKRLVSYLQGEQADPIIIKSAKVLEDHLESEALSEINKIFTCTNSNSRIE